MTKRGAKEHSKRHDNQLLIAHRHYIFGNAHALRTQYDIWRKKIYARDDYKCQFPGCSNTKKLSIHKIRQWSRYPMLRFNVNNGIVLCRDCYKKVHKNRKDEIFAPLFLSILRANHYDSGNS